MKIARIAYITETSAHDKHAWSGTVHYVYRALIRAGFSVETLGPAKPDFVKYTLAVLNKLSLLIFKKRIDYRHSRPYTRAFARIYSRKLKKIEHDIVVVCGGTEYGAYLVSQKPVFYILDRTIAGALNYHTILSNLWEFSKRQSIYTDKKAMLESTLLFFSSQWAANHAKNLYGITENKLKVIPFGANLDKIPSRELALKAKDTGRWNLLLIGTYWVNKGADIAFNTLLLLLKKNINAHLTVVGCTPPQNTNHERLTVIPFIDKNSEQGIKQLWDLFLSHHFFILPTRFDCTPIVFCEAGSFGLPILAADTGGVGGHIKEGVNGFLIPYDDKGEGYATKILEIIGDPETYAHLCQTSRDHYENNLNWDTWVKEFEKEIKSFISISS